MTLAVACLIGSVKPGLPQGKMHEIQESSKKTPKSLKDIVKSKQAKEIQEPQDKYDRENREHINYVDKEILNHIYKIQDEINQLIPKLKQKVPIYRQEPGICARKSDNHWNVSLRMEQGF